jgi:hypothetical protein
MKTSTIWIALVILAVMIFGYTKIDFLSPRSIAGSGAIITNGEESRLLQWSVVGFLLFFGGVVIRVQLDELNLKKAGEHKAVKRKYYKTVLSLVQMKNNLKNEIEESANRRTSLWTAFKHRLNHNLEELGHVLKILH